MNHILMALLKPSHGTLLLTLALILPAGLLAEENNPSASISEAYVEMHTGPGRGYPIVDIAERGETIEILKQRTDWVQIRTEDQKEGWVRAGDIANTLDQQGQPLAENFSQLQPIDGRSAEKGDWEMGIMLGDYGGTDVINAFTGYHFTNNLAVEVALSENFGNFSSGQYAVASILHQPFPEWRYSPFISLGGGVRKTNPRSNLVQTEDRTDDIIVVGAGIRMELYNRFVLRVQYNNHTVLTNRDDDIEVEEWKIGLSALF